MEVQDLEQIVRQREGALSTAFPALMRKVYVWMALALVITGICAFGTASSPHLMTALYSSRAAIWILLIAEIGLVFYTTARIDKLSLSTATTLFIIYSALNGVTLSSIFLVYTMTSITQVFFITAGTFGLSNFLWLCDEDQSGQNREYLVYGTHRHHHCLGGEHVPAQLRF